MNRNQKIWAVAAAIYIANTTALVAVLCAQFVNPGAVLLVLVSVEVGILIAPHILAAFQQGGYDEDELDDEAIIARLFEFDAEESLSFERNAEIVVAHLAAALGGHPPRTVEELLARLDYPRLKKKLGRQGCCGIQAEDVARVRMRLNALCAHFGRDLGGPPRADSHSTASAPSPVQAALEALVGLLPRRR